MPFSWQPQDIGMLVYVVKIYSGEKKSRIKKKILLEESWLSLSARMLEHLR